MAITKKPFGGVVPRTVRPSSRRLGSGVRVNAVDASRAAFFQRVADTRPTEAVLQEAQQLSELVEAAKHAPFLERFRRQVGV